MNRQAYIDTSRRSQSLAELRRKAAKSKRRNLYTLEAADLRLRELHDHDLGTKARYLADKALTRWNTHFCGLCGMFGSGWSESDKTYRDPVAHDARCTMHPDDDGPYPGWSAAGRKPDRASAGQAAPPEGQPPAGGGAAREASA